MEIEEAMEILKDKWQKEIDEIAKSIPRWEDHWRDYKERHPEEPMPEVMKKASFTRRMLVAKKVKKLIRNTVKEIAQLQAEADES